MRTCGLPDACGVCNGPSAIDDCGCSGIPVNDCDYRKPTGRPRHLGGLHSADGDGICDDADRRGTPMPADTADPARLRCGCADSRRRLWLQRQPARRPRHRGGNCTADVDEIASAMWTRCPGAPIRLPATTTLQPPTTTEPAHGGRDRQCGGDCGRRGGDGLCDDADPCLGSSTCARNRPGAIFDCGCAGIPGGGYGYNGNQLDARATVETARPTWMAMASAMWTRSSAV